MNVLATHYVPMMAKLVCCREHAGRCACLQNWVPNLSWTLYRCAGCSAESAEQHNIWELRNRTSQARNREAWFDLVVPDDMSEQIAVQRPLPKGYLNCCQVQFPLDNEEWVHRGTAAIQIESVCAGVITQGAFTVYYALLCQSTQVSCQD